ATKPQPALAVRKQPAMTSIQTAVMSTRYWLASGADKSNASLFGNPPMLWHKLAEDSLSLRYARYAVVTHGLTNSELRADDRQLIVDAIEAEAAESSRTFDDKKKQASQANVATDLSEVGFWAYLFDEGAPPPSGDLVQRIKKMRLGVLEPFVLSRLAQCNGDVSLSANQLAAGKSRATRSTLPYTFGIGTMLLSGITGIGLLLWSATLRFGRWKFVAVALPLLFALQVILAAVIGKYSGQNIVIMIVVGVIITLPVVAIPGVMMLIAAASGKSWLPEPRVPVSVGSLAAPTGSDTATWDDGITAFVAYIGSYRLAQIGGQVLSRVFDIPLVPVLVVGQFVSALGVLWWIASKRRKRGDNLAPFGFTFHVGHIWDGIRAYAAALPLLTIAMLVWTKLVHIDALDDKNAAFQLLESANGGITAGMVILMTSVGAPIFEEMFFRGFLITPVWLRVRPWVGMAAVSLFFACLHPVTDWGAIFVLGMGFAYWRQRTQSITPGIIAHAMQNGLTSLVASVSLSLS
ncbi:MAG: lysostaphin resistance A-like protein, partial [Armatimonadota bacterium]